MSNRTITAQPGKRDECLKAFIAILPQVSAEKGCIEYTPVINAGDPGPQSKLRTAAYMVTAEWECIEDLTNNASSDHITDYAKKTRPWVAERKVSVLRKCRRVKKHIANNCLLTR